MGIYLNPGAAGFKMSLNSEIFVDKSELLDVTNRYVNTQQRFMCVSRPRRFGKSMAADMLAAYYDCGDDTECKLRSNGMPVPLLRNGYSIFNGTKYR